MDNTRQVSITGAPNPEFDVGFQYQVITHMARDTKFFRTNMGWLKVEQFSRVECQLVLQTLYEFYGKYNKVPSVETMELYLADVIMPSGLITWTPEDLPNMCEMLAHIRSVASLEPDFYQDKMRKFVDEVAIYELMREAQTQGFGNQSELMMEGLEQIKRSNSSGGSLMPSSASADDPELMLTKDNVIRIPTGLRLLDNHLSGGLAPKEIGMVTACTGVGKTNALINFGLSAIIAGWNNLIITAEVPQAKMKRRFQAMSTGVVADFFKQAVCDWPDEIMEQYQWFLHPEYRYRGMDAFIDCSERKPTIAEIEQAIINWKDKVYEEHGQDARDKCRLVCVDWLDRISTTGMGISRNARSDELLTELPYRLGEVARRQEVALWTATQGTREADGQEVLRLQHTSGAYHKNDGLDVSLGLGRVNEEEDYNDEQAYYDVTNEDDDNCPPVDRDLVISLMKGRESAMAGSMSFKLYQGSSLRFWNSKSQCEQLGALTKDERYRYADNLAQAMGVKKQRVIL